MILRPGRIFRSRICRVLGVAFLLAAAWGAWWVWPPQPQVRVVIRTSSDCPKGIVTADGRSLICSPDWRSIWLAHDLPPSAKVFDLATRELRLTLTDGRVSNSI